MEGDIATALAQFGVAGLIGWMWLTERRAGATREKQLSELHDRLMQERTHTGVLIRVVCENTRALTALEVGQRAVASALERLGASIGSVTPRAEGSPADTPRPVD
jgi:hypothetical protein